MIICLFGVTYRNGHSRELERSLDTMLQPQLGAIPGFLSLHTYTATSGEVLGVVRFTTHEALEAWRNDAVHRSVWKHAPEIYESFWIQNCETYREYYWIRTRGRTSEDMNQRFERDPANLIPRSDAPDLG
ncbi:antibiotic biosynthesis monooxygenase [Streptomyces sp. NPDC051322]|uniref:antibiotic biosynthesis monooxygenase family protein n=1 Tax=Streptomyces sp. NPDC051322 TaxID=3154645 RepID=UPI00344F2FB2